MVSLKHFVDNHICLTLDAAICEARQGCIPIVIALTQQQIHILPPKADRICNVTPHKQLSEELMHFAPVRLQLQIVVQQTECSGRIPIRCGGGLSGITRSFLKEAVPSSCARYVEEQKP
eukprot:3288826-Karenia_brevis.AAC.1